MQYSPLCNHESTFLTTFFFSRQYWQKVIGGFIQKTAIKYIYFPLTSCRIWFTPAEVYVRSIFFSEKSRLKKCI
jgi:hypothetical protein